MPDAMADLVVILPWDLEEAEAILRADDDIAAVFYEGNLASALELPGGVAKHCAAVRALTAELGVLMVMDEVVCFRASHAGFQGPTRPTSLRTFRRNGPTDFAQLVDLCAELFASQATLAWLLT